jgi:hypothetical protein
MFSPHFLPSEDAHLLYFQQPLFLDHAPTGSGAENLLLRSHEGSEAPECLLFQAPLIGVN